jgi:hypothetical protein
LEKIWRIAQKISGIGMCPVCRKPFEVVAYGKDYYIVGCVEHREFDKVHKH